MVSLRDEPASLQGNRKNDLKHGNGIETNSDGSQYKGQFVEGKRQGKGTYTFPGGNVYSGQWVDNRMEGKVDRTRRRHFIIRLEGTGTFPMERLIEELRRRVSLGIERILG